MTSSCIFNVFFNVFFCFRACPKGVEMVDGAVSVADFISSAGGDGGGDIVFGGDDGVGQRQSLREMCGDGRREGTAGAVGVNGVEARRRERGDGAVFGVIEDVGQGVVGEVSGLEEDRHATVAREAPGGFGQLRLACQAAVEENLGLGDVGRDDACGGDEAVAEGGDCVAAQQRVARGCDHDGVDDDAAGDVISGEGVAHGDDQLRRVEHADLDSVGADVVEARPDLAADEVDRHGVDASNADGVLVDDGDDGAHAVAAESREGLEVGLQACASAGVAACDGEAAAVCELLCHIFHFSSE